MSKRLERTRENHRKLVREHARLQDRERKLLDELCRINTRKHKAEKAIVRSQKRLDVLVAAATHTTGPTGSVVRELIDEVRL